MDRIARDLLLIARELIGITFPTQKALDEYMKEHPEGDRSNHRVVENKKTPAKKEEPAKKDDRSQKLTILKHHPDVLDGFREEKLPKDISNKSISSLISEVVKQWKDPKSDSVAAWMASMAINTSTRMNKEKKRTTDVIKNKDGQPFAYASTEFVREKGKPYLHVDFIAAKPGTYGNGTLMMAKLIRDYVEKSRDTGVSLTAWPTAIGFYKKIGMRAGSKVLRLQEFSFTHDKAVEFSHRVFGELEEWKKEVTEKVASTSWLKEMMDSEPKNGALAGSVKKIKKVEPKKKASDMAGDLLRLAEEILPQLKLVFKRNKDAEENDYNSIHFEMQRFICTLRGNEELTSSVSRVDDDKEMVLYIGLSEHDEMNGIVRELEKMARKLAKKEKLEVEVSNRT